MASKGPGMGTLLLIGAGVAAFATNPTEQAHRQQIAEKAPVSTKVMLGIMELSGQELKYNNYYVFSTMSLTGKDGSSIPVSYGYFGSVHPAGEKKDDDK